MLSSLYPILHKILALFLQGLTDIQNHFWQFIITWAVLICLALYLLVKFFSLFHHEEVPSLDISAEPDYAQITTEDWTDTKQLVGEALNVAREAKSGVFAVACDAAAAKTNNASAICIISADVTD